MQKLNLPPFEANIKVEADRQKILDVLRRKFVALTPEEWVRQHFVHYLINYKGYKPGLLGNEVSVELNGMSRRCDTVLFDTQMKPQMIVEYKAPTIEITQRVFNQICRYNMVLKVKYLVISNGIQHYCCRLDYDTNTYEFLQDIPSYDML